MDPKPVVLICEDDIMYQEVLREKLSDRFELELCCDETELLAALEKRVPDILLLDICLRNGREGIQVLPTIRARWPGMPVVVHSAVEDFECIRSAVRLGAAHYILKRSKLPLGDLIEQCKHDWLRHRKAEWGTELIGNSKATVALKAQIARIRDVEQNILVSGEAGCGKEIVVQLLRREREGGLEPFVPLDSSTLEPSLADSELFGYERGAFTGADSAKTGAFENANGGTLYLDEIHNLKPDIQAKLLRVVQEREIRRIGSTKTLKLDFRIIATTNCDLGKMCSESKFRFDLLSRLEVFTINVPPLRERTEDIPLLVEHFLSGMDKTFSADAMQRLLEYDWPANVRELANTVRVAARYCDEDEIRPHHLPPKIGKAEQNAGSRPRLPAEDLPLTGSFRETMHQAERCIIERAYKAAEHDVRKMAESIKMDKSEAYRKLRKFGIRAVKKPIEK